MAPLPIWPRRCADCKNPRPLPEHWVHRNQLHGLEPGLQFRQGECEWGIDAAIDSECETGRIDGGWHLRQWLANKEGIISVIRRR